MTQEQQEIYDAVMAALQENAKTIADLTLAQALPDLATTFVELSNGQKVSLSVLLGGGLSLYEKKTEASTAHNELLNAIKGKSALSSAYEDPFRYAGTYNNYDEVCDFLDSIGNTDNSETEAKNAGWLSIRISGAPIKVLSLVLSWSEKRWTQMAFGSLKINQDGSAFYSLGGYPTIIVRKRDASGWSQWKYIEDVEH